MHKINYAGPSMNPTLRPGDLLFVVPYLNNDIVRGDVVAFRHPDQARLVVHRVVSHIGVKGVITRGDNNDRNDPWILGPGQIMGRVAFLVRGNRHLPVHGGTRGAILCTRLKVLKALSAAVLPPLRGLYHVLTDFVIPKRALKSILKPRVLVFQRPAGTEIILTLGRSGRVVGRRLPGQGAWRIRRPFSLFIDEAAINTSLDVPKGDLQ